MPPADGVTRVYFPVYSGNWNDYVPQWKSEDFVPQWMFYKGLEIAESERGALAGLYRMTHPDSFPLVLFIKLTSDCESIPRYQRLTR